jgi:uncharacterized protein YjbI with pentapeptide repeats
MQPLSRSLSLTLLVGCLIAAVAVARGQESSVSSCNGPYTHRMLTPKDLVTVLREHQAWLEAGLRSDDKRRANLCRANLRRANLQEAVLTKANLQGADLTEANLQDADLTEANLQRAVLTEANLQRAVLTEANLQRAVLAEANLQEAVLYGVNLQDADLTEVNLQRAILGKATLKTGINIMALLQPLGRLEATKLRMFQVWLDPPAADQLDLPDVLPSWAAPLKAKLGRANLQGAYLRGANLQEAVLTEANLQGADLTEANLQEAVLTEANLQRAVLYGAELGGAIFEPKLEALPDILSLVETRLEGLVFRTSPAALITLREAFKKAGMRAQERQLTYAVEHNKMLLVWNPSWFNSKKEDPRPWLEQLAGKSESLFSYVLFELPSGYGMVPSRALVILGLLIFVFSLVYMFALWAARGRAGIWATWPTDRVYQEEGAKEATRVTTTFFFPRWQKRAEDRWWGVLLRVVSVPLIGLYFSLLSAFSLGWRELNVGTWIARMQPREYVLRATGWVRFVAGFQSLLSVYLLALWVLTYFGRPFE